MRGSIRIPAENLILRPERPHDEEIRDSSCNIVVSKIETRIFWNELMIETTPSVEWPHPRFIRVIKIGRRLVACLTYHRLMRDQPEASGAIFGTTAMAHDLPYGAQVFFSALW